MILREALGKQPQICHSARGAENAAVIGEVTLGAFATVWYGAVLRGENLPLLRQNGRLCRLRRDVSLLPVEGRPISQSCGSLSELERQREPFYAAAADWTVDNNGPLEQTADQILKLFREQGGIL